MRGPNEPFAIYCSDATLWRDGRPPHGPRYCLCRGAGGGWRVAGKRILVVDKLCLPSQVPTQRAATAVGFASVQPAADRLSLLPVVKQAGMP